MRSIIRWLFILHRYMGIGLCLPMLMWCLSGVVMMYVPYPSLPSAMRLAGLEPIDWTQCCVIPQVDGPGLFSIEMMHGRLVMQAGGPPLDLGTGQAVESISPEDARAVALDFARGNGITVGPVEIGTMGTDQWTISGEFGGDRPLYLVRLGDAANTWLYVSSTTGRVVQSVNGSQRFWNYLGSVPHWLYFTQLRADPVLWTRAVVWTSLAGSILTVIGIYIGIRQWLRVRRSHRWSPYRGFAWWHHVPGLFFGIFLLSWVVSGFLSMNPWGLLEGGGGARIGPLLGPPASMQEIGTTLGRMAETADVSRIAELTAAPLDGRLYLIAVDTDGKRRRFDAAGRRAPLRDADAAFVAHALVGDAMARPTLLESGDDYYFSFGGTTADLPVWRLIGANGDRLYIDPLSGMPITGFDAGARGYRWLFQGLHRLDFTAIMRIRPVWDVLMLALLAGASLLAGTGVYMGVRHLVRLGRRGS